MLENKIASLLPFIPSGPNFESSRKLFAELSFEELWARDGYARFQSGHCGFILQSFDNHDFASNLMVKIIVADLDRWWKTMSEKQLDVRYPGFRMNPPKDFPWGREVNFIDLAGVCWHVAES